MVKIKRACWNCRLYTTCSKSKEGNYHCKDHKFIHRLKLNNN